MYLEGYDKAVKATKEVKEVLVNGAKNDIENMDDATLKAIQACLKFIDAAGELIKDQQRALYELDRKLEKLLEEKGLN